MNNIVRLKVISYNNLSLKLYELFLVKLLAKLNIPFSLIYLPKKKKKITLLTSPHVFKKAREQFQNTSYSFILSFSKKEFTNLFPIFKLNTPKTIKISIKFLS